jgi:uncharacterized membrane protein YphA (DoxX/SURF4 family)
MSAATAPSERRGCETAAVLARWLLGALCVWLGASKFMHHADFVTALRQQFMVTSPALSALLSTVWPAIEVVYGLWLISGIAQDKAALIARWWLGAVFVYMGLHKAFPQPEAFLKLVRDYHMVTNPVLLNAIAAALPWFEVYCGVLLLAGVAVRGTALNLIAMLVPFSLLVLKRALEITAATGKPFCAVKFDCGCGAGEVYICHKLVENSSLLLLAAWLLAGRGRQWCLRYSLGRAERPSAPSRLDSTASPNPSPALPGGLAAGETKPTSSITASASPPSGIRGMP